MVNYKLFNNEQRKVWRRHKSWSSQPEASRRLPLTRLKRQWPGKQGKPPRSRYPSPHADNGLNGKKPQPAGGQFSDIDDEDLGLDQDDGAFDDEDAFSNKLDQEAKKLESKNRLMSAVNNDPNAQGRGRQPLQPAGGSNHGKGGGYSDLNALHEIKGSCS